MRAGGDIDSLLDLPGKALWEPSRDPRADFSAWGDWEVWRVHVQHGNPIPGGIIAIDDWCAWDSVSGEYLAFPSEATGSARSRLKAEMLAVLRNNGRPTRVVDRCFISASCLEFESVRRQVEVAMSRVS